VAAFLLLLLLLVARLGLLQFKQTIAGHTNFNDGGSTGLRRKSSFVLHFFGVAVRALLFAVPLFIAKL